MSEQNLVFGVASASAAEFSNATPIESDIGLEAERLLEDGIIITGEICRDRKGWWLRTSYAEFFLINWRFTERSTKKREASV